MIKTFLKIIMCFLIMILCTIQMCYAGEDAKKNKDKPIDYNQVINRQINSIDFNGIEDSYKNSKNNILNGIDFKEEVIKMAKGDASVSGNFMDKIKNKFLEVLTGEVKNNSSIFAKLLILSLLCAVLKCLQDSFSGEASEIAFYACYIFMVILIVESFTNVMMIGKDTLSIMVGFMAVISPILIALIGVSGMPTSAAVFQPTVIGTVSAIDLFIKFVILPLIFFYTTLSIVNNISNQSKISNLCGLTKKICEWSMGITFTIFVAVISIQKVAASSFDGVVGKTTKFALGNFVPVVGGMLSDGLDSVISCTVLIKNSISTVGIIVILGAISIPLIKMLCIILIYKITAVLCQPVADERIVKCLNDVGNSVSLVFVSIFAAAFVFIIILSIIIGITASGIAHM